MYFKDPTTKRPIPISTKYQGWGCGRAFNLPTGLYKYVPNAPLQRIEHYDAKGLFVFPCDALQYGNILVTSPLRTPTQPDCCDIVLTSQVPEDVIILDGIPTPTTVLPSKKFF